MQSNGPAVIGKTYRIKYSHDMAAWNAIDTLYSAAVTGIQTTVISVTGEDKIFFRIEIVQ